MAQGCSQKYRHGYDETFSPVVRFKSIRMVIVLAVQFGLLLHQMNVTTTFLNGELKDVYINNLKGMLKTEKNTYVA